MEKLKIYKEYKFKKGGSEFYMAVGDRIKVRLSSGNVIEGTLDYVGNTMECFDIYDGEIATTIDCNDVVDIIPM